jgi:hypothetical protein
VTAAQLLGDRLAADLDGGGAEGEDEIQDEIRLQRTSSKRWQL